ncbi:MAG: GNAT family N-acetyltransferase [Haliea sp.]|nr:GNAT family N-acetyltransferase [Haliea sp.]MDP5063189.1 GNAT family N-acetyltransferase [Haliea sp.]
MASDWINTPFEALTSSELYCLLQLRQDIFVLEQACFYRDLDNFDAQSWHMRYVEDNQPLAYQRCLPPGLAYAESSLGRIAVPAAARGAGLGRELVQRGIEFNQGQWPDAGIAIGAQAYLRDFYASLGFVAKGHPYLEDGIFHVHMRLSRG